MWPRADLLRRVIPVAAIGAVIGGIVPFQLIDTTPAVSATAQIELTTQVEWPFYGAVQQRLTAAATSAGSSVEAEYASLSDWDVRSPADEAWIEIYVEGNSPDDTVAAADVIAESAVLSVNEAEFELQLQEANRIQAQLTELDTVLDELTTTIEETAIQQVEIESEIERLGDNTTPELFADLRLAQTTVSGAQREVSEVVGRQGILGRSLDELSDDRDEFAPIVRVLRSAEAPNATEGSPRNLATALGAVIGAMVAAVLAIMFWEPRISLRTSEELVTVPTVAAFDTTYNDVAVQVVGAAANGPVALFGNIRVVAKVITHVEEFAGDEQVAVIGQRQQIASVGDMQHVSSEIDDAVAESDVVLLDVPEGHDSWTHVALEHAATTYYVVESGTEASSKIHKAVAKLQAQPSGDLKMLVLASSR